MHKLISLAILLTAGACSRAPDAGNESQPAKKPTFEQQLLGLNESGRNLAFRNAIQDQGLRCAQVDRSFRQEAVKNGDMWVAHCTDGEDVALFVSNAGFAQVRRCSDLVRSEAPACKPSGQAPAGKSL